MFVVGVHTTTKLQFCPNYTNIDLITEITGVLTGPEFTLVVILRCFMRIIQRCFIVDMFQTYHFEHFLYVTKSLRPKHVDVVNVYKSKYYVSFRA